MGFEVLNMPGMADYREKLKSKKIVICDEMLALAAASARTPSYGLTKVLSKAGIVASLVVPNPDIIDIDQERLDAETGAKLTTSAYLATMRARYQLAFYNASHPGEELAEQPLDKKNESSLGSKLSEEERSKLVFVLRWKYIAYAMVSPPDCPTFPIFLFFKGESGNRNGDRNDLDNYEPVSLDALEFFHYDEPTDVMLSNDVTTIELYDDQVYTDKEKEIVKHIKFPRYDPRYPVYIFRRSGIGRELSNIVDPEKRIKRAEKAQKKLQQQQQSQNPDDNGGADSAGAAAAGAANASDGETAAPASTAKEEKKKDEKKEKKKREKKEKKQKEDAEENAADANTDGDPMDVDTASHATETAPRKSRTKKAKPAPEEAPNDPMAIDDDDKPKFRITNSDDLALLGVTEMQRDDVAINCVWVDRAGQTGHVATPTIAELDSLCRLYVKRDDPPSHPGDLAVRFLLTMVGKHNPGVSVQPFINAATKALVSTPAIGSMDINQLSNALTPDIINAAKDHVMRTAIAEETLRLAHNQHDIAVAKAAAAAAAAAAQ